MWISLFNKCEIPEDWMVVKSMELFIPKVMLGKDTHYTPIHPHLISYINSMISGVYELIHSFATSPTIDYC